MPKDMIIDAKIDVVAGKPVELPNGNFVANAEMVRDGADLHLTSGGHAIVVRGYFDATPSPDLVTHDGARLTPHLVDAFLPPEHAGQYAASGQIANDASPTGKITEVVGEAHIIHADGTKVAASVDAPVYQGDVIETSKTGAVNIQFADNTSFAISDSARLSVDQFVYDSGHHSGSSFFSMLQGVFVYTSGLIGKSDPGSVNIETPVGSIGIRGTVVAGTIAPAGQESKITILDGAISLTNGAGTHEMKDSFSTVSLNGYNNHPTDMGHMNAQTFSAAYHSVYSVAGDTMSHFSAGTPHENKTDAHEKEGPHEGKANTPHDGAESDEHGQKGDAAAPHDGAVPPHAGEGPQHSGDAAPNGAAPNGAMPPPGTMHESNDMGMMPGMNGMMPGMNGMMPGMNGMMPGMNGMMPGMNGMMPGMNGMMPGMNGMMPGMNGMMPGMNGMMPGMNGMMPGMFGMMPPPPPGMIMPPPPPGTNPPPPPPGGVFSLGFAFSPEYNTSPIGGVGIREFAFPGTLVGKVTPMNVALSDTITYMVVLNGANTPAQIVPNYDASGTFTTTTGVNYTTAFHVDPVSGNLFVDNNMLLSHFVNPLGLNLTITATDTTTGQSTVLNQHFDIKDMIPGASPMVGTGTLSGTAGADFMIGDNAATIFSSGGGADVIFGGASDDVINILDTTTALIDGRGGTDTLVFGSVSSATHSYVPGSSGIIRNIEVIDLGTSASNTFGNNVDLTVADVFMMTDQNHTLHITEGAGPATLGIATIHTSGGGDFTLTSGSLTASPTPLTYTGTYNGAAVTLIIDAGSTNTTGTGVHVVQV